MYKLIIIGVIAMLVLSTGDSIILYENPISTEEWQWSEEDTNEQFIIGFSQEKWEQKITQLPENIQQQMPEIDFIAQTPILAYLGQCPSGGYDIVIKEISENEHGITIVINRRSPLPGEFVTMAITYPYDLVLLDTILTHEQQITIVDADGVVLEKY